ncbi:energy-coupling factor transporter transmembrane component T [Liquorilactobacillus mali]|uniref:energy-coupling factor transporter transmembrane component T n=1 Tax=Liquorilactobacillus mali TaxID=1618 RepID=UPI002953D550|nr:energy-coupling factor transporter transmembrane component T [Liquorilactobacillus mali]MDV7758484.1 energy-coupling factor transporter transmembrane protein EcfT [Liquorilactobacillus mali]
MSSKRINPTILVIIMLGIGLQITFAHSVSTNIVVIFVTCFYLCYCKASGKLLILTSLYAFPLALGSWWSFIMFGTGDVWHTAWIYASRVYAYLYLGAIVTLTVSVKNILLSLSLHLKLSSTFVYGLLASFNLLGRIKHQFKTIRYSAMMRGTTYHFWNPSLYLRVIIVALNWSQDLAEAMTSQGFTEGAARTLTYKDNLPKWQWCLATFLILLYFVFSFLVRPW